MFVKVWFFCENASNLAMCQYYVCIHVLEVVGQKMDYKTCGATNYFTFRFYQLYLVNVFFIKVNIRRMLWSNKLLVATWGYSFMIYYSYMCMCFILRQGLLYMFWPVPVHGVTGEVNMVHHQDLSSVALWHAYISCRYYLERTLKVLTIYMGCVLEGSITRAIWWRCLL
jgi:hypothetical protein